MKDAPIEIQCDTMDEIVDLIRGTKPDYFVTADDPKSLKYGWATEKHWYTISYYSIGRSKNWKFLSQLFETDEGRKEICNALLDVAVRQVKLPKEIDPVWDHI